VYLFVKQKNAVSTTIARCCKGQVVWFGRRDGKVGKWKNIGYGGGWWMVGRVGGH
jgi:hypothetical protein